jgi:hypothetical protein
MGKRVAFLVMFVVGVCCCLPVGAFGLGGGRVYEMVSPTYKGGYGANGIDRVSLDGESVVFTSPGAFAGAPSATIGNKYLARRGGSGWETVSLEPPAAIAPYSELVGISPTLDSVLFSVRPGPNRGVASYQDVEHEFLSHSTNAPNAVADWELEGMVLNSREEFGKAAVNVDFSHILFEGSDRESLLPEAENTRGQLYELVSAGGGGPLLRLVGVDNSGGVINPLCPVLLGFGEGRVHHFNALSADGGEVFFSTALERNEERCDQNPHQLFVRVAGSRTLEVSKPLTEACEEVPCPGAAKRAEAIFEGASEDGSRVFFTTASSLVSEDLDVGNDLYMAKIGCPGGEVECKREPVKKEVTSLVQVSHDPNGGQAGVQGVVNVSPDGSHVYFVAHGDLSTQAERTLLEGEKRGVPHVGADNLYVYDSIAGHVAFVADLCSGPGVSGGWNDGACPLDLLAPGQGSAAGINDSKLWLEPTHEAQVTGDGRFLVFSSYGRLAGSDTDSARDVYRYDAQTGVLDRVSVGEAGSDANGNNSEFDATVSAAAIDGQRAVSEDGSRIVFTTAEPLSERAINHFVNVYEWYRAPGWSEGRVSLISPGNATEPEDSPVISPSGRDIFFATSQGLVPQDTDGAPDVYDARLGGGFPLPAAPRQPCSGDACQGALSAPAPLLVPGSVSQAPGGNFAAPSTPVMAKAKPRSKPAKCKKGYRKKKDKCAKKPPAKKASHNRRVR